MIALGGGPGLQTGVAASTPVCTLDTALNDLASPANTMTATAFSAPMTSGF